MKQRVQRFFRMIFNGTDQRLFLIPVAAMVFVFFAFQNEWNALIDKPLMETIALILTGSAFAVYAFRAKTEKNPLMKIMCALSFSFFCREIHFMGTSSGVYIAAAGIAIWAWCWKTRLKEPVKTGHFKKWLFATGWAYFLALFIQRRALKHLVPIASFLVLEQELHTEMEEFLEVIAHLLLLVTAFQGYTKTTQYE